MEIQAADVQIGSALRSSEDILVSDDVLPKHPTPFRFGRTTSLWLRQTNFVGRHPVLAVCLLLFCYRCLGRRHFDQSLFSVLPRRLPSVILSVVALTVIAVLGVVVSQSRFCPSLNVPTI